MWRGFMMSRVLYSARLRNPFFQLPSGTLAPQKMMDAIPGAALVAVSLLIGACSPLAGMTLSGGEHAVALAVTLPIFVHWSIFALHSLPRGGDYALFDAAGQIAMSSVVVFCVASRRRRGQVGVRVIIGACLTLLWSCRLGVFLYQRFKEARSDFRFEGARKQGKLGYLFFSWTMQGAWCVPVALHIMNVTILFPDDVDKALTPFDYCGIVLFFCGLLLEHIADEQKLQFRRERDAKKHEGEPWIASGVWSWSRHPNYFGEMLLHFGLSCLCATSVSTLLPFVSPLFAAAFLHVTSLEWLEIVADQRYGHLEAYTKYKQRTSVFLMLPPRDGSGT